jgi:hypothetical protein
MMPLRLGMDVYDLFLMGIQQENIGVADRVLEKLAFFCTDYKK